MICAGARAFYSAGKCTIDKKRCHLPNGGDCYKIYDSNETKKKPGRPPGSFAKEKRVKNTLTMFKRYWDKLDEIGPSRGKAIEKLLDSLSPSDVL